MTKSKVALNFQFQRFPVDKENTPTEEENLLLPFARQRISLISITEIDFAANSPAFLTRC